MTLDSVYGAGRLGFGAALIAAPERAGNILVGAGARKSTARMLFRFYGTRDIVLGLGTLRAASNDDQMRGWLMAGIASDVLDAAVMLMEWNEIPAQKRLPGLATALGAAGVGAALLMRRRVTARTGPALSTV